jgi:hypothetical protein
LLPRLKMMFSTMPRFGYQGCKRRTTTVVPGGRRDAKAATNNVAAAGWKHGKPYRDFYDLFEDKFTAAGVEQAPVSGAGEQALVLGAGKQALVPGAGEALVPGAGEQAGRSLETTRVRVFQVECEAAQGAAPDELVPDALSYQEREAALNAEFLLFEAQVAAEAAAEAEADQGSLTEAAPGSSPEGPPAAPARTPLQLARLARRNQHGARAVGEQLQAVVAAVAASKEVLLARLTTVRSERGGRVRWRKASTVDPLNFSTAAAASKQDDAAQDLAARLELFRAHRAAQAAAKRAAAANARPRWR